MQVRLYFALCPDEAIRLQLARPCLPLARESSGRAVYPVSLHLTLAFLGQVDTKQVAAIEAIGDQLQGTPFTYTINIAGCFPRAHVAWLGGKETPWPLLDLQKNLTSLLATAQHGHDTRAFRPHITIARDIQTPFDDRAITPVRWPIDRFCLVAVRSTPGGREYEILKNWPLRIAE